MNKLTILLKKFSLCVIILACSISSVFLFTNRTNKIVKASDNGEYVPSEILSADFTSTSKKYPLSVSNWTTLGNNTSNVTMGIISTDSSDYSSDKYEDVTKLNFNPRTLTNDKNDANILMINSPDHSAIAGYKSPAIKLEANSFYHITFNVYTVYGKTNNSNSFASVRVSGENLTNNEKTYYSRIQTQNSWQTVDFYIASNELSSKEVNVELRLGNEDTPSYGAVFFDNFIVEQISNNQYYSKEANYSGEMTEEIVVDGIKTIKYESFIDLTSKNSIDLSAINPDFENGLTSWSKIVGKDYDDTKNTIANVFSVSSGSFDTESSKTENPSNAFRYNNKKALLINNIDKNSVGYKSSLINIERNKAYAISIDSKAGTGTETTIKVVQNNRTGSSNFEALSVSTKVDTSDSSNTNSMGGWETYTFYIKGNYVTDNDVYIELWVGDESTQKGYAWFDNVRMQEISLKEYSDFTSSSSSNALNLAKYTEPTVPNGFFNNITSNEIGGTLTPESWTVSTNAIDTSSVNVSVVDKDNYKNVLRIRNKITTGTMVTSEEISVEKDTFYTFSVDAKIEDISTGKTPYVIIYNNDNIVYTLPLNTDSHAWNTYSVTIKNPAIGSKYKFALCLGGMNDSDLKAMGIVYFDNIKFEKVEETDYDKAVTTLDLFTKTFANDYDKVNDNTESRLYSSLSYAPTENNNEVRKGILDLKNFDRIAGINLVYVNENPKSNVGNYVYVVNSGVDTYYTIQGKEKYSLSASDYYKLTISLKTVNLGQDEGSKQDKDAPSLGAFIGLNGIDDAKILSINTSDIVDNNGYASYSIYVNSLDAVDVNVKFGLGQLNSLTKGALFVESISFENITSEQYDEASKSNNDKVVCVKYSNSEVNEDGDGDVQPEKPENKVDFNFLVVPTLITALALIIAIVFTLIRKLNIKHNVKIKNEYDRANVIKAHNLRESIAQKEEKAIALNKELDETQSKLDSLQLTDEMTIQEQKELQDQIYKIENSIGQIKEEIAQNNKALENLKDQLNKM